MKKILVVIILALFPASVYGETALTERPHWSLEIKGGQFIPDIENWSTIYGDRSVTIYGGSLAYKFMRQLEFGIEGARVRATGQGAAIGHGSLTGTVNYELAPLDVFVLARGIFTEDQWIVPYVAGGWTRVFYREEVKDQSVARGSVDGYHARAGIQFLLDNIDRSAANSFYLDYGIYHTYLFLEAKYTRAMIDTAPPSQSINLGGISWLGGLLFEF